MVRFCQEWNLISDEIKSLLNVSTFLYSTFKVNSSDEYNAMSSIGECSADIIDHVSKFKVNFEPILPESALQCLMAFFAKNNRVIPNQVPELTRKFINTRLVRLAVLEANLSYCLNDTQTQIHKTVEIAFSHLQRQLIADTFVNQSWCREGNKEIDFEKLGSAHLLLHKIWAFKVDAKGERTDLILSEPIKKDDPLYQSVDGLVLTEWKVVDKSSELDKQIHRAKKQVDRYAGGSLGTLELSTCRYLIMVSKEFLKTENIVENGITYRVINIAYSPSIPSRHSN